MTKVNGSLGFTLRKEDESILGHYIRSLVKEPAISDGRIRPGDKIISVSGIVIETWKWPLVQHYKTYFLVFFGSFSRLLWQISGEQC